MQINEKLEEKRPTREVMEVKCRKDVEGGYHRPYMGGKRGDGDGVLYRSYRCRMENMSEIECRPKVQKPICNLVRKQKPILYR